jgi:hypothetical protein
VLELPPGPRPGGGEPPRQPGAFLRRVKEVEDDQFDARKVLSEPIFQPDPAVGEPNPAVGAVPADGPGGGAEQRVNASRGGIPAR